MKAWPWLAGPIELTLLALIAVSYALVFPVGEYAIMDDWAYVKALQHLHDNGELRILDWNPMSLVGLLFWAWPFVKVFGFSFTVTKISVVVLFGVECLALVRLLRLCSVSPGVIFGAAATLIFNPLHFVHAFMFMTDVPAIAWELLALVCYVTAFARSPPRSCAWLGVGSLLGAMSFLTRQNGLLVHLAFFLYIVLFDRAYLTWRSMLCAFAPAAAVVAGYQYWYGKVHGATSTFESSAQMCLAFLRHLPLAELPYLGLALAMYLGLFILPLSFALPWKTYWLRPKPRIAFSFATCAMTNVFLYYAIEGRVFPYFINVMNRFGFFGVNEFIVGDREILWGRGVAYVISACGFVSLVVLANRLCASVAAVRQATLAARALRLSLILLALQLAYCFATTPILFDRHLLMMAPTVLSVFCLLCPEARRINWGILLCLLSPMAFYSVTATHDLHAIARTAFRAGDDLIAGGVNAKYIVGGYAFDGWTMYERSTRDGKRQRAATDPWWVRELEPDIDARYIISLSPSFEYERYRDKFWVVAGPDLSQYELFKLYTYRTYWPWKQQNVYVLKRRSAAGTRN